MIHHPLLRRFLPAAALLASALGAEAQVGGELTPSGPPGPTMKSLDQVAPRTPLVDGAPGVSVAPSGTITVSQPGSYYLTGNLAVTDGHGIAIESDNVTLDLGGFTISSAAGASGGAGVRVAGSNIAIRNGLVVGGTSWDGSVFSGDGFDFGIEAPLSSQRNVRVRDITVRAVALHGIYFEFREGSMVESCVVKTCGTYGIRAGQILNCLAAECGNLALWGEDLVSDSTGKSVSGSAINADIVRNCVGLTRGTVASANGITGFSVIDSYGLSDGGDGIAAGRVTGSIGYSQGSGDGIAASQDVTNSYGYTGASGDDGIDAVSVAGSYGVSEGNGRGIEADGNVSNSHGEAASIEGIFADHVTNSEGSSGGSGSNADGIRAMQGVAGSYGFTTGDDGIAAGGAVTDSYGETTGTGGGNDGVFTEGAVTNSHGLSAGGNGIDAGASAANSYGESTNSGSGIRADGSVMNSVGVAAAEAGIRCGGNVLNSKGESSGQSAGIIAADGNVTNSIGESADGNGIQARNVANSFGRSRGAGDGIQARNVTNSDGVGNALTSDDGIDALGTISFSYGYTFGGAPGSHGLECEIAIGCTSNAAVDSITNRYLMP